MIPVFTICMVVFVIVLKININKNKIAKDTASSDFWEREHEANFARRQDISGLDYISIPLETPILSGCSGSLPPKRY